MMRPATRRGIWVLGVAAAAIWYFARQAPEPSEEPLSRPDVKLNYALYDFSGHLLDDRGRVSLQIRSPELRNDAETGIGTVDSPEIRIRQDRDRWFINAESAIISPDREEVWLRGDVYLSRRVPAEGRLLEIASTDVLLNVTPRTAHTDAAVSIRERGDRLDAVGMRLDMINETYELLSDVRAHYEVP
jgi:LPS export ABC transporter protein LptC